MRDYPAEKRILGRILEDKARQNRKKTFLQFGDREISYEELNTYTNRVAHGLLNLGVRKNDKVAVMLPNCPEFLFADFALAKIGAVAVPLNTAYKGQLLGYVVGNCDAKHLLADISYADRLNGIQPCLEKVANIIFCGSDVAPEQLLQIGKASIIPFEALLSKDDSNPQLDVKHYDLHAIMYTSGTTGSSKGVMVTHSHSYIFARDWVKANAYTSEDILYTPLPLFHAIAHTLGVIAALIADSKIAIADRFHARKFWQDVRSHDATVAHTIFSMIPILLNQPESELDRQHRLRAVYIGPSSLSERFEKRFGAKIVEVYGQTETGIVTCSPYGDWKLGSCGKANEDTFEVRIFDEADNELPPGEIGEIVVRPKAPFAMTTGYYNMLEETSVAFRNLWFHSGDLGYRDGEGFFYFVDRKKDCIRRRGENISSFEVEKVINAHPAVLESAVIAVPSELLEDEIKVCVVLRLGAVLTHEALISYCLERLPYFMVPRYVEFKSSLPKTANEKVEKFKLRAEGNRGITQSTWDCVASGVRIEKE